MLNKDDFENYRKQVSNSLKVSTMAVRADTLLLNWIDSELKAFPKEKLGDKIIRKFKKAGKNAK